MEENISNQEEIKTGGYKVESVILIESNFSRLPSINQIEHAVTNEINISHEVFDTNVENTFGVILTLDFVGKQSDVDFCTSKIKMLGIFEKVGEPPLNEESFKKINAPAIIYPFIREHLHNICLKAGVANVLLPTVNFKL
jgi:preprotein translocase subunit SecB